LTEENPVLLLLRKVVFVVGNESESDDVREWEREATSEEEGEKKEQRPAMAP
jgi:hypothetical protein